MLTHNQARSIAEAVWGRGGTNSERTTRPGAFYFSCSGHGGFVIDAACLTDEELVAIGPYIDLEDAQIYRWGRRSLFNHPYRTKGGSYKFSARRTDIKFFLLEEDCMWCLAYIFTGIRHRDKPQKAEHAQETFNRYFKKEVA